MPKAAQGSIPEVVELFTERCHPSGIEAVDPPSARGLFADQPRVLEDLEVLRYRGPRDRQLCGQIADRQWAGGEHQHDCPPRAIPERDPDIPLLVSGH